ncbi:MAG: helix-turn-helix domain-containing protein [Planctomycetes bacterium]|nr:helix-turn-helix domain-containing protein [Planctomycetota bacterium]
MEGYTAPAIARSLNCSRRVCPQRVQRYHAGGLEGLQDKPGRGKPPLLTPAGRLQSRILNRQGRQERQGKNESPCFFRNFAWRSWRPWRLFSSFYDFQ